MRVLSKWNLFEPPLPFYPSTFLSDTRTHISLGCEFCRGFHIKGGRLDSTTVERCVWSTFHQLNACRTLEQNTQYLWLLLIPRAPGRLKLNSKCNKSCWYLMSNFKELIRALCANLLTFTHRSRSQAAAS